MVLIHLSQRKYYCCMKTIVKVRQEINVVKKIKRGDAI